ncbi:MULTISPECIES: hypothetical protein [unclassified Campylobacter]|uniref:hypothetical protein n=1 Tax=unclassified Campylobacter TaxID=2593542 RepID=UPI0022E9F90C|nr:MULTISPECIES: hypothetical protein [unclassified Campylobacter]MDA3062643.1 penicillin-binding protein activator LpoB [Campylobacter sp. JMF_14 EL1]MDA3073899.1 penicillin-binding protein activator LpoB [Campylobacter sp. JMF_10 EL2]
MRILNFTILSMFVAIFFAGCIATKSPNNEVLQASKQNLPSGEISNQILEKLAKDSTKNLLSNNKFAKEKGRFSIIGISEISCEKRCEFDTDFLRKKLKVGLIHSGKVVVIDAPSKDEIVFSNDGIKKSDTAHAKSIYAPDFLLVPSVKKSQNGEMKFELSLKETENKKQIWSYNKNFNAKI